MNSKTFGSLSIFRPNLDAEKYIKKQSKKYILSKYKKGVYKDTNAIGEIIKHQFSFYNDLLKKYIKDISSRHLIEFLLYQYDQYTEVEYLYKNRQLTQVEDDDWVNIGPMARRAIKYFVERVVLLTPEEEPTSPEDALDEKLSYCWIAAEELTRLYILK